MDGRLSRSWCEVAQAEILTRNLPIANPALYHTATSVCPSNAMCLNEWTHRQNFSTIWYEHRCVIVFWALLSSHISKRNSLGGCHIDKGGENLRFSTKIAACRESGTRQVHSCYKSLTTIKSEVADRSVSVPETSDDLKRRDAGAFFSVNLHNNTLVRFT